MKILVFFLMAASAACAAPSISKSSLQQQFQEQFQSSRIQFPDESSPFRTKNAGRYSVFLKVFFQNILGWVPDGAGRRLTEECEPEVWGRRIQDERIKKSVQLQGALIQKYFRDCAEQLETGDHGDFKNLSRMMSMKLEPEENPFLHPVIFHLPGNVKLKGLLALKGDFKKRPLVVLRLGVFSNVQEFLPERPWFMMLFEQSPFNVLVLENMSSSDFIANNSKFSFGGYDEGIQNILIAQMLKDPNEPLHRIVESLHLFGISLGGHGVFYASMLNDLNSPKLKPLYQSFMAMCPVVKLEASMHALSRDKPFAYAVDLWSRKRLAGIGEKMPAVNDHESFGFLEKTVSEVARTYTGGLSFVSSVKLPEGVKDSAQFWKLNDFWSSYKSVREPVLVFATHDDPIVSYSINSENLQNHQLKIDSSNISVVDFTFGIHCTLPIPYDWKALSTLLQSYILSHSPGFKIRQQSFEIELGKSRQTPEWKMRVLPLEAKSTFVKLEIEVKSAAIEAEKFNLNLPLSQFDFRFLNHQISSSEEWMIERWVNQNVQVQILNRDGKAHLKASWPVAL